MPLVKYRISTCTSPANSLWINDRGLLQPGKRADLAFFEKNTNRPLLTVCRGKIVYDADARFNELENS